MQLAATTGLVICKVSIWYVPPLVVVVEVGVGGLVVEGQVGGAGEPRQRHVGLSGAFLKGRKKIGLNYESCVEEYKCRFTSPKHVCFRKRFKLFGACTALCTM